jgi:multidrug efflux pump subunit AcrB
MGGVSGIVFRQFGVTASVAVLASLLVARLLTPMLAAAWMKPETGSKSEGAVLKGYLSLAEFCLKNPGKTMAAAVLIFALSLAVIPFIETSFRPPADICQSKVTLTLAPGTDIEETRRTALEMADLIGVINGVRSVFTAVGVANGGGKGAPTTGGDSASAVLTVSLTPLSARDRTQSAIEAEIRKALSPVAGARVEVGDGEGVKLELTLAGDDTDLLEKTAYRLENDLRGVLELGAVSSGAARQAPEIQIIPDFAQAAALGVTTKAMAEVVRVAASGAYSAELPKLNLPERQVPIKVRFNPMIRGDLNYLAELKVSGRNGPAPLGSAAELTVGGSPAQINRIDRQKSIAISVELNGMSLGRAVNIARNLPTLKNLPQGVSLVNQGETQRMNDLLGSLGVAMFIGVFCVYAVLVLLFKDFKQPVTILAAMPLALGGALVPLVVTGHSFSLAAAIGVLMLMGIVAKNSILLVEYAVTLREQGSSRQAALLEACRKRARPIVMTSLAMAGGMMPVIFGLSGGDPSFRRPMGIVVAGGLITSTFLSLIIIPVIYTLVDDLKFLPASSRKKCKIASQGIENHSVQKPQYFRGVGTGG